jgi:hypothetical protein
MALAAMMLRMGFPSLPGNGSPIVETASRTVMFAVFGRDEVASSASEEA